MAPSIRPRKRTASRCIPETDRCTHVFEIDGYSLLKGLGAGEFVRSATFTVGGHDWCVQYCPDGETGERYRDYISVYLELMSKQRGEVRAACSFGLVNQVTGLSEDDDEVAEPNMFRGEQTSWGCRKFMKKTSLEASPYLRNDRLVIECDVTVVTGTPVSSKCDIQVPPSDLADHLGRLLETKQGQDVTFKVGGRVYHAHRIVLAMQSPVFMAELYGPMKDSGTQIITVEEMQPAVFELLLQFIYTDSLPDVEDLGDVDDVGEFVKHLLVAADRYCMDRMKLICESILSKRLDAESVGNILALADQYHCSSLKDACIEFMHSSSSIDDVIASKGYVDLTRASPAATVEIWEKAAKSRMI